LGQSKWAKVEAKAGKRSKSDFSPRILAHFSATCCSKLNKLNKIYKLSKLIPQRRAEGRLAAKSELFKLRASDEKGASGGALFPSCQSLAKVALRLPFGRRTLQLEPIWGGPLRVFNLVEFNLRPAVCL